MLQVAVVTGAIARVGLWLAGIGIFAMVVIIAAQVFTRYVLDNSIQWTEPMSVMIMGWFIFLGAAVGIREGYHLSFDVFLYFVPERVKLIFFTISDIFIFAFAIGMAVYGWQLAAKVVHHMMPTLGISDAFNFAPLICGGVLLALFCLERIARRAAGLPTSRFGDNAVEE